MMPTRYTVDLAFDKTNLNKEILKDPMKKKRPGTWYEQNLKNDTRVERINGSSTS